MAQPAECRRAKRSGSNPRGEQRTLPRVFWSLCPDVAAQEVRIARERGGVSADSRALVRESEAENPGLPATRKAGEWTGLLCHGRNRNLPAGSHQRRRHEVQGILFATVDCNSLAQGIRDSA